LYAPFKNLLSSDRPWRRDVEESLRYEVEFWRLLWTFANQLAKPLRFRDDVTEYIPTRKLADAIGKAGVADIRYPSAMAPGGTNVVLLDPAVADTGPSRLVQVVEMGIAYRPG